MNAYDRRLHRSAVALHRLRLCRQRLCRQRREEVADLAVEPRANRLQRIEANVLHRYLQALQGRLQHPDAAGERKLPLLTLSEQTCKIPDRVICKRDASYAIMSVSW